MNNLFQHKLVNLCRNETPLTEFSVPVHYRGARIIYTKIRENFVRIKQNVRIINTSKLMELIGKHTAVQITMVQIIWDVGISEVQIIRAILYDLRKIII